MLHMPRENNDGHIIEYLNTAKIVRTYAQNSTTLRYQ